jgi:hypothetical protein
MDHVVGPLHILVVGKEGRVWLNIVCLKLYQFERITWWCLFVLEHALQSMVEFVMESTLQSILLEKKTFKK